LIYDGGNNQGGFNKMAFPSRPLSVVLWLAAAAVVFVNMRQCSKEPHGPNPNHGPQPDPTEVPTKKPEPNPAQVPERKTEPNPSEIPEKKMDPNPGKAPRTYPGPGIPQIRPAAEVPQNFYTIEEGDNNHKILTLTDKTAKDFFREWRPAIEWVQSRQANMFSQGVPSYASWQDLMERDYLNQQMYLKKTFAPECGYQIQNCPPQSDGLQVAEKLNREYHASDALRLWQINHMATAYMKAIMDEKIRYAAIHWDGLGIEQKRETYERLVAYELDAFSDLQEHVGMPKITIEKLRAGLGAQFGLSMNSPDIVVNISSLNDGAVWNFGAAWHECYHYIEFLMQQAAQTPAGAAYLRKNILMTDVYIYTAGEYFYIEAPKNVNDTKRKDVYQKEPAEADVRVSEALGRELANEIIKKGSGFQWTEEDAQHSLYSAAGHGHLENTEGVYAGLGELTNKLIYENALHKLFWEALVGGDTICVQPSPPAGAKAGVQVKMECISLKFTP
jgi:hypothetical protein